MIPVQLTIKGLYSYQKSETIDFQPLVAAKLFGIFGPVGSGKSAILEAIMFVLFDRSARLNKAGDDCYYHMMNLQSNELIIDFIFKNGRDHKNKYRFYFMARRKVNDFQKVEVRDRSYYQWLKNQWEPMKKSEVLGITYENFMQTVIIPLGKFREFIDQKPAARTQMLKELFDLDRFDIASNTYRLLGMVKEQCNFLDGQLSLYTDVTKAMLRQLDKAMEGMTEVIDIKILKEQKLMAEIDKMQVLQHLFLELTEVSEYLDILASEAAFYQKKQHQLNRFQKVQDLFRDKILQQRQLLAEAKSKQEVAKARKQWNHQKGLLQSLEIQVADINTTSNKLETELLIICEKESFKGLNEVQKILALGLNVEQERWELEKYRADINMLEARQKALRKKMGRRQYQQSRHQELVREQDTLKDELHQLHHDLSGKQHAQQQMQFQLQKKKSLTKELNRLLIRKDNIQEISNLLRGNGFINFISSVYLQDLCKTANVRFTKLTDNRLSLVLSEQNEFMVRDYLNDGKLRLLKTLSGGQVFQASLCLALSLAENVKILNQADQSFFFLDEGFGSLDRTSLPLVFETLKSLQKENRIVGIISPVEELQSEIDTYLVVHQHQKHGSTISRSWESTN